MNDPRPLILHIVYRFAVGGLENGVVNLINRLPHDRWRHAVVALTEVSDTFGQRVRRDDVQLVALGKPPGHGYRVYPQLFRLCRRLRPAIVHTRNLAALEAVIPVWAAGVPVRIHGEHGRDVMDLDGTSRKYQWMRRLYRPFVHHYVALSRDLERYLVERVGVPPARVTHVYNGVDTDRFRASPVARAPLPGSPFNDPRLFVIGTVGRLEAVKDHMNLVRALALVLTQAPQAQQRLRWIVVGDGPLRAMIEQAVRAAGIESLVWFAGERSDVPDVLRALDCFVLPSLAEGISNTLLEAMATALPVIATRVGANADLMEDGRAGRLVPRGDPQALAGAILAYLADPATARRDGAAGRQIIERRFGLERMIEAYGTLYSRLITERGAGSARTNAQPARG